MSTPRGKAMKGFSTLVAALQTIWTQTQQSDVSFLYIDSMECT